MNRRWVNVVQKGVKDMRSITEQKEACPRCHGFMVPMIGDGFEAGVLDWCEQPGRRCVNCGEQIDPLILANRRSADRAGTVTHPRRRCGPTMTEARLVDRVGRR